MNWLFSKDDILSYYYYQYALTTPKLPYYVQFNDSEVGPMTQDEFKTLFQQSTSNIASLSIVNDELGVSQNLQVSIVPCETESASGISTFISLNKGEALVKKPERKKMFLQYPFYFDENFNWGMGGKLPGIGVCEPPSGCLPKSEAKGASFRLMWRGYNSPTEKYKSDAPDCNRDSNCPLGYLYAYIYSKNGTNDCGDYYDLSVEIPFGYSLEKKNWYVITYFVDCGDEGMDNGTFQIYVSNNFNTPGKLVCSCKDIPMIPQNVRDENSNWVFLLSIFRGGKDKGWSSDEKSNIYFKYFKMVENIEELIYPIVFEQETLACSYNQDLGFL